MSCFRNIGKRTGIITFTTKTGKRVSFVPKGKPRTGKMNMAAVRAAIASPRTPVRLKQGLKRKYHL